MRIGISCLLVSLDKIGGLQTRIKGLISGLCMRGHKVVLLQTPYAHEHSREFKRGFRGDEVTSIPIGSHGSDETHLIDLFRFALYDSIEEISESVDVLDSYDPYLRISNNKMALIHSSNYYFEYILRQFKYSNWGYLLPPLINTIIRQPMIWKADMLIVENSIQKEFLLRLNRKSSEKIDVILPGYDNAQINQIMDAQNADKSSRTILYSGRLNRFKGLIDLVEAFRGIHEEHPDWMLKIVGDGPLRDSLETIIGQYGLDENIVLLGDRPYQDNLKMINEAEIIVLPSYVEGVPLILIESMAMGKAIVTTDVGAISRHLIEDGKNGLLVPPGRVEDIMKAISNLISDNQYRDRLSKNARIKAENLTLDRMTERTLETYIKAIANAKKRTAVE